MTQTPEIMHNPLGVAASLRGFGGAIDYQPGDGTRYEVRLAYVAYSRVHSDYSMKVSPTQRWLIVSNLNILIDLSKKITLNTFCLIPNTRGTWAALRPLLVGLGAVEGNPGVSNGDGEYDPADSRLERQTRETFDGEEINYTDAHLGSKVRRLVEAEGKVKIDSSRLRNVCECVLDCRSCSHSGVDWHIHDGEDKCPVHPDVLVVG